MNKVIPLDSMEITFIETKVSFEDLFGLEPPKKAKGMQVTVREWEFPNPEVPAVNKDYYFTLGMLRDLLPYLRHGKGQSPYIFGSHGTSKTSSVEQISARLGLSFLDTDASQNLEVIDLIGQMMPNANGGFSFKYGILARAMKEGHVLVINEYDLLPTLEQKALNRIVEDRQFTIVQTGEVIKANRDFRLVFTGNTNNTGSTANFASSGCGDSSINDRLKFVKSDYLPREVEENILKNVIKDVCLSNGVKPDALMVAIDNFQPMIKIMLDVAKDIRGSHEAGKSMETDASGFECSLSIRSLKEWCRMTLEYNVWEDKPLISAFETSFVAGIREEEREAVSRVLLNRVAQ